MKRTLVKQRHPAVLWILMSVAMVFALLIHFLNAVLP
jgi:hypothetical protein